MEEVRFGILRGNEIFHASDAVASACKTPERHAILRDAYVGYFRQFEDNHALDTYVFCLSEHGKNDNDGLLSMWRGYGGNGTGAALVFDTSKIEVTDNSPLMVARVHYASTEARLQWLEDLVQRFAALLDATSVPDDQLHVPAYFLFERIKLFALFSKHDGFREEQEWRVVYAPDRDEGGKLSSMFHYSLGPRGAELRLRLKIAPLQGVSDAQMSLSRLLDRIILGPSISSLLASKAVIRMLDSVGKSNLSDRVVTSLIPFRPS
jgi:hypothetical protein